MCMCVYIYICMKQLPTTLAQLAPQAAVGARHELLPLHNSFHLMSYDTEYLFSQFKSAVLILFPSSSLGPSLRMALGLYNTA